MSFKENFNRICKDRGTSPYALCVQLGLSTSKITAWNKGSLPKEKIMIKLAELLSCSVMDFFADEDLALQNPLDEDERDILRTFRTLSRRDRHEFMAIVYEYEKQETNNLSEE